MASNYAWTCAAVVDVDGFRINQVLYNLLGNALKFTPPGGRIQVAAKQDPSHAVVTIEDTGAGLEQGDMERLFQPFVQIQQPSEASEQSTGLGLYISKAIVEAHGGTLWVESAGRGKGCTFHFTVPLAAPVVTPAA